MNSCRASTNPTSSRSHARLLRPTLSRGSCVSFLHAVAPGERQLYNNHTINMATIADLAEAYGIPYLPASGKMPENTNRGDGLCIMTWAMLGVATVLVAGRVMSKILVLNKFRLDDIFLLLTWVRLRCFIRHPGGVHLLTASPGMFYCICCRLTACVSSWLWPALSLLDDTCSYRHSQMGIRLSDVLRSYATLWTHLGRPLYHRLVRKGQAYPQTMALVSDRFTNRRQFGHCHYSSLCLWV
jgi:hypothetical protein